MRFELRQLMLHTLIGKIVFVCYAHFAGVQKLVILHLDTRGLETYAMLLVLCKPFLATITRTLRLRSVHINSLCVSALFICH